MTARPVLIVLPQRDFDPSEVALTWKVLSEAGNSVLFATPDGVAATADPLMLSGEGLDLWGRVPVLRKFKLLGLVLRANIAARRAHASMQISPAFRAPASYSALSADQYDGLVLPGGHWARGMRQYLTYPEVGTEALGYRSVQAEVSRALAAPAAMCRRAGREMFTRLRAYLPPFLRNSAPLLPPNDRRKTMNQTAIFAAISRIYSNFPRFSTRLSCTCMSPTRWTRPTSSLHGHSPAFGCCTARCIARPTLSFFAFGSMPSPRWHCGSCSRAQPGVR